MLNNMTKGADGRQYNSFDTDILKQGFSQLPTEGKIHLRDYLKSLVSIQNIITEANENNAHPSSKDKGVINEEFN